MFDWEGWQMAQRNLQMQGMASGQDRMVLKSYRTLPVVINVTRFVLLKLSGEEIS